MRILVVIIISIYSCSLFAELSFNDAFKAILNKSTEVSSAEAKLDAASTAKLSSKMIFLPTLALEKSKTEYYADDVRRDALSLSSSLNLFRFGSDVFKATATSYNFQTLSWNRREAILNAELETATILLDYISEGLSLSAQREYATVKKQAYNVAKVRAERGLLSIQESQKTEIDLINAEAQLRNSELAFIKVKSRLSVYLGETNIKINWPWLDFIEKEKHVPIASSTFEIDKTPEYKKSQSEAESSVYNLKSARSSILPSVDLSYTYSEVDIAKEKSTEQVGLIKLTMPIFNGLTDYANMREQHARMLISQNNLEQTKRDLSSLWDERSNDLLISGKNAIKGQEVLRLASSLYDDSFKRFEQGRSSVNDLLLDQSRLLESENLAINSWYKAHLALIGVCHLKGLSIFECI